VRHRTLLAALGCAAMVLASAVHAAEESAQKSSASLEEARQHAAKAKVHYDLGEFEKAAEEYILVYRLRPLPALLFNIAQSYRQAGQYEKAKQFYKSYLRETSDPKNRAVIEKAIREIDELLAREKRAKDGPPKGIAATPPVSGGTVAAAPPPAAPSPQASAAPSAPERPAPELPKATQSTSLAVPAVAAQPPPAQATPATAKTPAPSQAVTASAMPTSRPYRTYAYISAGAAAVFIATGLAFGAKASKYEDELSARPHPQATINDLSSTAKSSRTLGAIFFATGLAAGVGAGLLYFVPSGDGVTVQGRF
jgi:tetratricopeptide (TPR) repeat protein